MEVWCYAYGNRVEDIGEVSIMEATKGLDFALQQINTKQKSWFYKMRLVLKRFYHQCIKSRNRKDFVKWFFSKAFRRQYSGKSLRDFDHLEEVKSSLKRARFQIGKDGLSSLNSRVKFKRVDISKTVVIFASVPFYDVGGGQRSAQLAKTFNEMGYIVHYIYGFECSEEDIPEMFIPAASKPVSVREEKHCLTP